MTDGLEELAAWLREARCVQVVMESTAVYWQPVWNVLEDAGGFDLLLVNARHARNVPGCKTDINDAEWLADLLDERIDAVSAEIAECERPFADDLTRLDTIPGVGQRVAEIFVAELGRISSGSARRPR